MSSIDAKFLLSQVREFQFKGGYVNEILSIVGTKNLLIMSIGIGIIML